MRMDACSQGHTERVMFVLNFEACVCEGGDLGGGEKAQRETWMACFNEGKAAGVSRGQIWE